jgi:excisionase family DNA binding protein
MNIKAYLTVRQISKQLGLTEYRIRQLIREKQIRATKIGQWRVMPKDLEDFIKSRSNIKR